MREREREKDRQRKRDIERVKEKVGVETMREAEKETGRGSEGTRETMYSTKRKETLQEMLWKQKIIHTHIYM